YWDRYIDFKWITVNYVPLVIDPDPLNGEPNKPYQFTARSKGAAPASAKYVWNFGDGSNPETVVNDSTVNHTFTKEGSFRVKVELFDHATNTRIADTASLANIQEVRPVPVIDSVGCPLYLGNETKFVPWGARSISSRNITIHGKDWSTDPDKTFVKVDGVIVPIINLISGSGKYEVNSKEIKIDIPADKKGNINITVESNGMVSAPMNFFIGIPLSVLQKMPAVYLVNQFRLEYVNSNQGNRLENDAYSFTFSKHYNQIVSSEWNGNVLTVNGFIQYPVGVQDTELRAVYTFSEDGMSVTSVESTITSLNLDIVHTTGGMLVNLDSNAKQLRFVRLNIPAADFSRVSGQVKTTQPRYIYEITRMVEGTSSWPNQMRLNLEFIY
ncbi:MAG: PKD domain-containing protein, partial [Bacteroidales bacterium]